MTSSHDEELFKAKLTNERYMHILSSFINLGKLNVFANQISNRTDKTGSA